MFFKKGNVEWIDCKLWDLKIFLFLKEDKEDINCRENGIFIINVNFFDIIWEYKFLLYFKNEFLLELLVEIRKWFCWYIWVIKCFIIRKLNLLL